MAIEVTPVAGSPKFPRAYRSISDGIVVLFFAPQTGFVIVGTKEQIKGQSVGAYGTYWKICSKTSIWEPVNIAITHD